MKKIIITLLLGTCLLAGCGKYGEEDVIKDFSKKIDDSSAYYIEGSLELVNNDDIYHYDVEVAYKEENNYRVSLTNVSNSHTQIILKNSEGVFVVTPSLNKSFKFQSDWPYNNSQIYLLESLVSDIKDDDKRMFKETKDGYTFMTEVNYPNNRNLVKQKSISASPANFARPKRICFFNIYILFSQRVLELFIKLRLGFP